MFLNIWTSGPHLWSPARRPLPLGFHCSPDLCDFTLYWPSQQTSWRHAKRCRPTGVTHLTTFVIFVRCSCSIKELKKNQVRSPSGANNFIMACALTFFHWLPITPLPPPRAQTHTGMVCKTPVFSDWVHLNGAVPLSSQMAFPLTFLFPSIRGT